MMRDAVTKWTKVRKVEPQEAFGGRRFSVKVNAEGNSGPDPSKEPC
jgi:hypothetical protein